MLPAHDETYIALAASRDKRFIDRWALIMSAKNIPHEVYNLPDGWTLYVRTLDADLAQREIEQYQAGERERKAKRRWPNYFPEAMPGLVFVLGALAIFHSFTYAPPGREFWLSAGHASASRITDGQWWLTITALTLHADLEHVGSNIVFGGIVLWALRRVIGAGRAWPLVLLSGALGNYMNALFYASAHNSIGASTAVFGAVGILSAVQVAERFRMPRTRIWIPFAAGLALLASLGSSEKTDIMAHLFGFIAGIGVGLIAIPLLKRDIFIGRGSALFLSLFSFGLVLLAWGRSFCCFSSY
ncbi:MAG TPA: rhomboid family intramembrane serine protease [bacterium]|nr:rhomboid family intramembrane serine protease [bacterium]